ncbi:choice-of-anchor P family protein [Amycolatopsis sp. lyj-90]|uniref:choice-of-anchor P family protein n=1 Tax=Amycolatopsis sp. lyj-90 TaxID=2789285 RepID=UPI00397BE52C
MFTRKALVGGIALSAVALTVIAPSAGAAGHGSSAFALSASGLLKIDPVPAVDGSDGFRQKSLAEFTLPLQLVKVTLLNAQAGESAARASVKDVEVNLGGLSGKQGKPLVSASAIQAECKGGKGSSSLAKASIGGVKLDVAAAPNTAVGVEGLASVTLNKQVKHKDGSITVTALSISVDGFQTLDLASVTCAAGGGDGSTTEPPTGKPSTGKPSSGKPSAPPTSATTAKPAGDKPTADGKAPTPTPVKAHLDVTG